MSRSPVVSAASKPALSPRHYVLAAGLALSIAAALWAAQIEPEGGDLAQPVASQRRAPVALGTVASAAKPGMAAAPLPAPLPVPNWAPAERGAWAPAVESQFAAWAPPAPPPPPPAPPPSPPAEPVAPPFPYQLIGRLVEAEGAVALLSSPAKTLAVKTGEVIDGQWRVDQIHERGLNLTWLPAKLTQSVNFRAATP
ncbi:hypothetical protein C1O66_14630 [Paucibacter aquatile]|uniref:Uncharacterized protein n=1 Tax=Kinneretia aquatilis TaxID=2070761 RepID=A0A2N8KYV6_9BURK|nr:hypothetical protein [Paucibacter aquatile]PND38638.1 hypothetical protein C1O66_14630 [Paucibacter aquatile]